MTTPPWKLVTPEQLKMGWMEMRGVTPIHHNYLVIKVMPDGNYVVKNPEVIMAEHPLVSEGSR